MLAKEPACASESEAEVKVVSIDGISWRPISDKLFLDCGEFVGARYRNSRMPNYPLQVIATSAFKVIWWLIVHDIVQR